MSSGIFEGGLEERILRALEEVRPGLRADGGDIKLVKIDGTVVEVRLVGACAGCPMAASTLAEFVVERIKLFAPEVTEVLSV